MDDLETTSLSKHKEAVKSCWNSEHTKQKWHGQTYKSDFDCHLHYWIRQKKTLKLLDELNLPKSSRILELGYGGAETAGKILERGFKYYGVDISEHLYGNAKKIILNILKMIRLIFIKEAWRKSFILRIIFLI